MNLIPSILAFCLCCALTSCVSNKQPSAHQAVTCGIVACPQPHGLKTYGGNVTNATKPENGTNLKIDSSSITPSSTESSEKPKWQDLRFLKDVIMKSTATTISPTPQSNLTNNVTTLGDQNDTLSNTEKPAVNFKPAGPDSLGAIYKFYQKFREKHSSNSNSAASHPMAQVRTEGLDSYSLSNLKGRLNAIRNMTKEWSDNDTGKVAKNVEKDISSVIILNCTDKRSGSFMPVKSALINNSLPSCTLTFRTFFHGPAIKVNVVLEMGPYSIIVWTNGKSTVPPFFIGWKGMEIKVGKRVGPFRVVVEGVCQDPTIMPFILPTGQDNLQKPRLQRNSSALLLDSLQLSDCVQDLKDVLKAQGDSETEFSEQFTFTKNGHIMLPLATLMDGKNSNDTRSDFCQDLNASRSFLCTSSEDSGCIPADQVCDLVADCPNGEDESSDVCGKMPQGSRCNFEGGWCSWENEEIRDKMQWFYSDGFSSNGPKADHTLGNVSGHYLHFSGAIKGSRLGHSALLKSQAFHPLSELMSDADEEKKIISPEMYDSFFKNCKIRFWYHMNGPHTGALELWVNHFSSNAPHIAVSNAKDDDDVLPYDPRDQGSFHRIWRVFGESEDVWKKVEIPLFQAPNFPESFFLEFIAKRGLMDQGDVAIDDISLSKDCFGLTDDPSKRQRNTIKDDLSRDASPMYPFIKIISEASQLTTAATSNKTTFKFDNCQSTGRLGPDVEMCKVTQAENSESVENSKINKITPKINNSHLNDTHNYSTHLSIPDIYVTSDEKYSGIQAWRVPRDGFYKFTAMGARGGKGVLNSYGYGKGAQVTGSLELKAGEVIFMLVGQEGQDACKSPRVNILAKNSTQVDPQILKICNDASHTVESSIWDYYERKGYAGGGGGGGGATYIFRFDNGTQSLIPLFVAAGGGGASVKMANRLTSYQIYPKLDPNGQGIGLDTNIQGSITERGVILGDGYSNPKGAGGGGGWESTLNTLGLHNQHIASDPLPHSSPSTIRAGGSLLTRGGKGGLGVGCGKGRGKFTSPNSKNRPTWHTDGGFGGGGAPCTAGGGGGGYRGGDAPLGNSLYENGAGGHSYASPLAEKAEGLSGINDKSGLVIMEAILRRCPCSFKCKTLDPYHDKYTCLCPPDALLGSDGKTCKAKSWFKERPFISSLTPKHMAIVVLFAVGFTVTLSACLIYLAFNQPKFRKKFFNRSPVLLSPHDSIDAVAGLHAPYQNGLPCSGSKGGLLPYLAQLRREILAARSISPGYIEALNHELQLDELRQMSTSIDHNHAPNDRQPATLKNKIFSLLGAPSQAAGESAGDEPGVGLNKASIPMTEINPFYGQAGGNGPKRYWDSFIDTDLMYDYDGSQINEIPREKLKLVKALGEGAFGEVYQGILLVGDSNVARNCQRLEGKKAPPLKEIPVAVKTLPENSKEVAEMDFFMEAFIMSKFRHKNIVKFYGTCLNNHPRFIVLEYLAGGDLKNFLREIRTNYSKTQDGGISVKELLELALDVANGCRYLEENHFVHRDIAARNCLLTSKLTPNRTAKIADFGMSRDVYRADYYRKGGKAMLPVKWMPPEAFLDGLFTTKTDVWSYGVLLWEVFSLGYMPYPGRGNQEVMVKVTKGYRLECPPHCPKLVFALMNECWEADPNQRPKFGAIVDALEKLLSDPLVLASKPIPRKGNGSIDKTAEWLSNAPDPASSDNDQDAQLCKKLHESITSPSDAFKKTIGGRVEAGGGELGHTKFALVPQSSTSSTKNSQSTSGRGESITCCSYEDETILSSDASEHTLGGVGKFRTRLSDSLYSQCSSYDYLIPLTAPPSLADDRLITSHSHYNHQHPFCVERRGMSHSVAQDESSSVFRDDEDDESTIATDYHGYENIPIVCASSKALKSLDTTLIDDRGSGRLPTICKDNPSENPAYRGSSSVQALSCVDMDRLDKGRVNPYLHQTRSISHIPSLNDPLDLALNKTSQTSQKISDHSVRRMDPLDTSANDAMRDSGIEDTTATLSSCCASSITDSPKLGAKQATITKA